MSNRRVHGFTLIEMIIAIVIISVGLAGVLAAFVHTVKGSADPLIHKQMLSIAEEMMEEVLLKPYTALPGLPAPTLGTCARATFTAVSDYNGYDTSKVNCDATKALVTPGSFWDIDGTTPILPGYTVSVVVNVATLHGVADAQKISLKVTHSADANGAISLVGWRTNYGL